MIQYIEPNALEWNEIAEHIQNLNIQYLSIWLTERSFNSANCFHRINSSLIHQLNPKPIDISCQFHLNVFLKHLRYTLLCQIGELLLLQFLTLLSFILETMFQALKRIIIAIIYLKMARSATTNSLLVIWTHLMV